jgi:hypothetical protein
MARFLPLKIVTPSLAARFEAIQLVETYMPQVRRRDAHLDFLNTEDLARGRRLQVTGAVTMFLTRRYT